MNAQLLWLSLIAYLCSATSIKWPEMIEKDSLEGDFIKACVNGDTDYIKIAFAVETIEEKPYPIYIYDGSPHERFKKRWAFRIGNGMLYIDLTEFKNWYDLGCALAIFGNHHETAKVILDFIGNLVPTDLYQYSGGNLEIFKLIIEKSDEPSTDNVLSQVCMKGYVDITKYLIELRGANAPMPKFLLLNAILSGNPEMVRYIADLAQKSRRKFSWLKELFPPRDANLNPNCLPKVAPQYVVMNDQKALSHILSCKNRCEISRNLMIRVSCQVGNAPMVLQLMIKKGVLDPIFKIFISNENGKLEQFLNWRQLHKSNFFDLLAAIHCSCHWNNAIVLDFLLLETENILLNAIYRGKFEEEYLSENLGFALQAAILQGNYSVIKTLSKSRLMKYSIKGLPRGSLDLTDNKKILRIINRARQNVQSVAPSATFDGILAALAKAEWDLIHVDLESDAAAHQSHIEAHNKFESAIITLEHLGYSSASINILREFQANLIVFRQLRLSGLPSDLIVDKFSKLAHLK